MLDELESSGLEVMKVPGRHGGYIRVPVSVNAEWYRHFCRLYGDNRTNRRMRQRTMIKRCHTIAALKRLIAGNSSSLYAERLIAFVERERGRHGDRTRAVSVG